MDWESHIYTTGITKTPGPSRESHIPPFNLTRAEMILIANALMGRLKQKELPRDTIFPVSQALTSNLQPATNTSTCVCKTMEETDLVYTAPPCFLIQAHFNGQELHVCVSPVYNHKTYDSDNIDLLLKWQLNKQIGDTKAEDSADELEATTKGRHTNGMVLGEGESDGFGKERWLSTTLTCSAPSGFHGLSAFYNIDSPPRKASLKLKKADRDNFPLRRTLRRFKLRKEHGMVHGQGRI